jgi:hypothetical protein
MRRVCSTRAASSIKMRRGARERRSATGTVQDEDGVLQRTGPQHENAARSEKEIESARGIKKARSAQCERHM